tara:strand:- start:3622 stop:4047 length:426 start_codon:yes stop_codon:yes gene_type:complete
VAEALAEVQTDTYRLVLKSRTYHWNVTGPLSYSLHEMTEALYTDMFAAGDVLAESIRALGKPALVNLGGLIAGPSERDPDGSLTADDMGRDLRAGHDTLAQRMRALVLTAEAAGDPVTADLATERAAFREKTACMLRATAT